MPHGMSAVPVKSTNSISVVPGSVPGQNVDAAVTFCTEMVWLPLGKIHTNFGF